MVKKSNTPKPVPTLTPLTFSSASPSTAASWVSRTARGTTDTLAGICCTGTASLNVVSAAGGMAGSSASTSMVSSMRAAASGEGDGEGAAPAPRRRGEGGEDEGGRATRREPWP